MNPLPLPHQFDGLFELRARQRSYPGALLAFDPGLGKTRVAIDHAETRGAGPVLVICPASLEPTWRHEVARWTENRRSCGPWRPLKEGEPDFPITDYATITYASTHRPWAGRLISSIPWKAIIIDEIHHMSKFSDRSHALWSIIQNAPHVYRLGLTGTPIAHYPKNLQRVIHCMRLALPVFGGDCDMQMNFRRWKREGRLAETFGQRVSDTIMYRRTRESTGLRLPEKIRKIVPLPDAPTLREEDYETALETLQSGRIPSTLREIEDESARMGLRKLPHILERVKTCLAGGDQVAIFCKHLAVADALIKALPGAAEATGRKPPLARADEVARFETGLTNVIVATYAAAGTGVTMNAANRVLMVELPWRHSDLEQAEERAGRVGSGYASVVVEHLVWDGTWEINLAKRLVANSALASVITTPAAYN